MNNDINSSSFLKSQLDNKKESQRYEFFCDESEINKIVTILAKDINGWLSTVKEPVIAVPIMTGALFFASDLLRKLDYSLVIIPVISKTYDTDSNTMISGNVKFSIDDIDCADKTILLIDDICDSSKTLMALKNAFITKGASTVKSVTFLRRNLPDVPYTPDFYGINYDGPDWFTGYGMDDQGKYRNTNSLYILHPEKNDV